MKSIRIWLTLLFFSPLLAAQSNNEILRTAGDKPIDIQHICLELAIDIPGKTVVGQAQLHFQTLSPIRFIDLDAVDFEVRGAFLCEKKQAQPAAIDPKNKKTPLSFRHDGKKLKLELPTEWPADRCGCLVIDYTVHKPRQGLFFFGPTKAEPDVPRMVWSQGEAITNRYWFPCLDHPDQRQTTEIIATVANDFEVISNGKLISRKTEGEKTVFHWKQAQTHVSYLVTLVVGQFDIVEEPGPTPLYYYVPRQRKDDIARTFGRTREMMEHFSAKFGINYPWEKYAQVVVEQFTSGGMENTSATTLTDRALHDQRSMLDSSPDALIAHELAHQWWGDLVTCRDWAHIWLNEGFASFCEIVWAEYKLGRDEADYALFKKAHAAQSGGKERPIVDRHYPSPRMMFDDRAYPKGAWVLHMLRAKLGEETFWRGIRYYGQKHKYKSVETSDLRRSLEKVSGKNLERFFYDWTERPGHPILNIRTEFLTDRKQLKITVNQTQASEPFQLVLPIAVITANANGGTQTLPYSFEVMDKDHSFVISLQQVPLQVVIDPTLTILAEITENKDHDLWIAQLKNGPTISSRIAAARSLGASQNESDLQLLAQALNQEKFWGVGHEIASLLVGKGDPARAALIQGLKHSHPKVRRACAESLASFTQDKQVENALRQLLSLGDPSYYVEAEALKSLALVAEKDALPTLQLWLTRSSNYDVLRVAAITGLGTTKDQSALPLLLSSSERGHSRPVRIAAFHALVKWLKHTPGSDAQKKQILDTLMTYIKSDSEMPQVRRNSLKALIDLGEFASSKLNDLMIVKQNDPDEYVQELVTKAIEQIKKTKSAAEEIGVLRDEIRTIREENIKLKERLERLEKHGSR